MSKRSYTRPYVGLVNGCREAFRSATVPTPETHPQYGAVIGPFKTMRAARFTVAHGNGNPHIQSVADAERIARAEGTTLIALGKRQRQLRKDAAAFARELRAIKMCVRLTVAECLVTITIRERNAVIRSHVRQFIRARI